MFVLRVVWLAAQSSVALWFCLSTASDRQWIFLFAVALSFPIGLVAPFLVAPIFHLLDRVTGHAPFGLANMLIWVGCVAAGYWQWFVFVPRRFGD